MRHIKKLVKIFKRNRTIVVIGRNRNNMVKLPKRAPKNTRFRETLRFNVILTVNKSKKSKAKFKNPTKSR